MTNKLPAISFHEVTFFSRAKKMHIQCSFHELSNIYINIFDIDKICYNNIS